MQQARYCAPFAGRMLAAVGVVLVSIVAAQAADIVVSSTIPNNGDLNPYGIVFVQKGSLPGL